MKHDYAYSVWAGNYLVENQGNIGWRSSFAAVSLPYGMGKLPESKHDEINHTYALYIHVQYYTQTRLLQVGLLVTQC